jgi:hypothetical protein
VARPLKAEAFAEVEWIAKTPLGMYNRTPKLLVPMSLKSKMLAIHISIASPSFSL